MESWKYINDKKQLVHVTGNNMDIVVAGLEKKVRDMAMALDLYAYYIGKPIEKCFETVNDENKDMYAQKILFEEIERLLSVINRNRAKDKASKLKIRIIDR
jgi:hypothetical protein